MAILTLKVIASLIQLHGPDATIQSDHQGLDALLADIRSRIAEDGDMSGTPQTTQIAFRKGAFVRGGNAFRRGGAAYVKGGGAAFRKGGFLKA